MKIRSGFVSNSSSSSFVYMVDVNMHQQALARIDDPDNILQRIFQDAKEQKFCDNNVIVINGGDYEDYCVKGGLSNEDISKEDICAAGYEYYNEYWEDKVEKLWNEYKGLIPSKYYFEIWDDR